MALLRSHTLEICILPGALFTCGKKRFKSRFSEEVAFAIEFQQTLGLQNPLLDSRSNPDCSRLDRRYQVSSLSCSGTVMASPGFSADGGPMIRFWSCQYRKVDRAGNFRFHEALKVSLQWTESRNESKEYAVCGSCLNCGARG